MATEVTRTLNIDYDNCQTYLTANGVSLHINLLGTELTIRHYLNGSTHGYAQLNSSALDVLFPTASAKPFKLDFGAYFGQMTNRTANWIELRVNDSALKRWQGSVGEVSETFTGSTVESMTKSSAIQSYHNSYNTVTGTSTRYLNFTLHFWQYSCTASKGGNGVETATVSNASPYQGDSVTFSATLKSGATWHGWYSDAACTQLVSTSQTYTTTAADLALYAYATKDTSGTGIYLKQNGEYKQAQAAYKKVNGVWVEQTDVATLKSEMQSGKIVVSSDTN